MGQARAEAAEGSLGQQQERVETTLAELRVCEGALQAAAERKMEAEGELRLEQARGEALQVRCDSLVGLWGPVGV